ncbi:MAG: class I SAM-dependent methyltransferase [Bryobacteraceae bacterium]|nr:class I SAM-dependent methyltransferase [Bryobacteraceae bacterium]
MRGVLTLGMKFREKFTVACCAVLAAALALPAQYQDGQYDVPYVPTPQEVVDGMLDLAQVKKTDLVYDLGCGDGRIVVTAARKYGARAVGVDINPERISEAQKNAKEAGVTDRVKFVQGNLFEADIKDASVVTLYLLSSVNLKLRPKLLAELKPGTRIVSNTFDMGDWKPDKQTEVNGRRLYFWIVPKKAPGD